MTKYIASVSFGKDSLAMLLRLLKERHPLDAVVFYDTGMEFQSIYNIRDRLRPVLQENGVEYIELRPKEPFLYSMFEREVKYRKNRAITRASAGAGGAVDGQQGIRLLR